MVTSDTDSNLLTFVRRTIRQARGRAARARLAFDRADCAEWRHANDFAARPRTRLQVGERYADLEVVELLGRRNGSNAHYALCRCRCAGRNGPGWRVVRSDNLRAGRTTSCGCWRSHKGVRWRDSFPPGNGGRGNHRTYVVVTGDKVAVGQAALLLADWPKGSEYRRIEPSLGYLF